MKLRLLLCSLIVCAAASVAFAEDPPGFPSTPGSSTPAAPATTLDDFAKDRMAALAKFARDHDEDPMFLEREGPGGRCRVDHARKTLVLTFSADGTLHCKAPPLAESYVVEAHVLTVKALYATGNHYRVTAKPGRPLPFASVRGTASDVKAAVTAMAGRNADYTEAAWWTSPRTFGPFHAEDVTLTVALDEAGVREDTALSIAPLYAINLGVVATISPGVTSYLVADGAVREQKSARELGYYFGLHLYPLSWARIAKGRLRPGRYFEQEYVSFADRLSLLVGVDLARPRESGYVGLALEVYAGVALTAGWQPRKVPALPSGVAVGDEITGDALATDSVWDLGRWGVGLSLDASLLKPIVGYLAP